MLIIDNAGFQFIDSCNESPIFGDKINFIDFNSDLEGEDYEKMLQVTRREYNKEKGAIAYKQVFSSNWIRRANEHLQACIDHKNIWFASRASAHKDAINRIVNQKLHLSLPANETVLDLVEEQDSLIYQTKKQCALIEVKSTARGTQTFDLPLHLKRSTSAHRARRDNYTALLLGNWAVKCYYDMMAAPKEEPETFIPRML